MGHILRSNQTQLYKYLLYFIYFQISQNENQNLYMIYFFLIYLNESKLLDKQFILLKHIIIQSFSISLSTISNYEIVFYFFLSFQVQKKKGSCKNLNSGKIYFSSSISSKQFFLSFQVKYASNCNCFFTIYFATIQFVLHLFR